jgi:dihydrolipoamide dehydrogenase
MTRGKEFDLIVIGAGPGGYTECLRAAQLGMKIACVEKDPLPGGVCLNVGCIPSKALLDSSEYYRLARARFADHGILADSVRLDLPAMMARKEKVVKGLGENVRKLMEGAGVEIVRGSARLTGRNSVEVHPQADDSPHTAPAMIEAANILLATGSEAVPLPALPCDGVRIVDSTGALSFETVPEHLLIVGGGAIGLELGSVWRRLGSRVTVVELLPVIAAALDGQVSRTLERILTRQGFTFLLSSKLSSATLSPGGIRASILQNGRMEEMECDRLLAAIGRRPLTKGLGLESVGVGLDSHTGCVLVDTMYRTSIPTIYAVGDLIAGPALAHKAFAEGIAAVECMAGLPSEVNYDAIPSIVYTSPEAASVGWTEERLKERGIRYRVGTCSLGGTARARCMGEADGFVKLIAHAGTGRLLGAHIIAARASDMISECVLAMELNAHAQDIARAVHGHPTFSEAVRDAAAAIGEHPAHGA